MNGQNNLLSVISPLLEKILRSSITSYEIHCNVKIPRNMKLHAHEVFSYNFFTSIKQNYTIGVSCHLQSSEEDLSGGKNMNT